MRSAFVFTILVAAALAAPASKKAFGSIDFDRYWSLDEIYDYMDVLEAENPGITEVEIMGGTIEGRQIRGLRITSEEHLGQETLPVIFVTAGASARDWISVMAAVDIMHELVDHYEDFQNIVDNIEWFIIPVANPDGYEFSRLAAGNRNWIKNRRPNNGSDCVGTNVERNFVFNWGLDLNSNSDPCSDNFRGPAGDSEEETKTIQFAIDITRRIQKAYITIKAGSTGALDVSSMVTYPFSSNNELFQPNFRDQMAVGNLITDAIWRQTGGRYRSTSESNAADFFSGTSGDYASGQDHIPFVYTFYAPAAGSNGWDVPENQINRIVDEICAGVFAVADYVTLLPMPDPIL